MKNKSGYIKAKAAFGKSGAYFLNSNFQVVAKQTSQSTEDEKRKSARYLSPPFSPISLYDLFEHNIWLMIGIRLKAKSVAGIGYEIIEYEKSGDDFTTDPEYIKLKSFLENPNLNDRDDVDEITTFENIATNLMIDYFLYGYGFLEVVPNRKGELAEIYNLRSYNTFARIFYNKLYYVQTSNGTNDVMFVPYSKSYNDKYNYALMHKSYNPKNRYYGLPSWITSTADVATDKRMINYRINKLDNNMMIQFVLITEGCELDGEALKSVQEFMAANHKGVDNAGKVLSLFTDIPEARIRIEKIESEFQEVGYIASREQNRDFILSALEVPAVLVGATTKGQLGATTQFKDAYNIFNESVVKPEKRSLENILNHLFRTKLGITKFKIEFKELKIETLEELTKYVTDIHNADIIDTNEARTELGYEPRDDEDTTDEQLAKLSRNILRIKKQIDKQS